MVDRVVRGGRAETELGERREGGRAARRAEVEVAAEEERVVTSPGPGGTSGLGNLAFGQPMVAARVQVRDADPAAQPAERHHASLGPPRQLMPAALGDARPPV